MINFLANEVGTYKKLSLIGFDFFSCEVGRKKSKSFHKETRAFDVHKGGPERVFTENLARKRRLKIIKWKK